MSCTGTTRDGQDGVRGSDEDGSLPIHWAKHTGPSAPRTTLEKIPTILKDRLELRTLRMTDHDTLRLSVSVERTVPTVDFEVPVTRSGGDTGCSRVCVDGARLSPWPRHDFR